MTNLLADTASRAARYIAAAGKRPVQPRPEDVARLRALGGSLPDAPSDPRQVLALLDDVGSPATVVSNGGRYFGFVIGGALPVALAANWLAGAWDQNMALRVMSPVGAAVEDIALDWVRDIFGLPPSTGAGL
jgi:glutamate/tyrosine decarboxylase-like PLP-dependent enzyme